MLPFLWLATGGLPLTGQRQAMFSAIDNVASARMYEWVFAEAAISDELPWAFAAPDNAAELPVLTTLLVESVSANPVLPSRVSELLEVAGEYTDARVREIVSHKHRAAYPQAAALAVAHAEALAAPPRTAPDSWLRFAPGIRGMWPFVANWTTL